jgi:hypothetical protein
MTVFMALSLSWPGLGPYFFWPEILWGSGG